jgi:TrmH family RNA methyltransferase
LGTKTFLSSVSVDPAIDVIEVSIKDLEGLGEFQTNESALAVASLKENELLSIEHDEFALVLDDIRDPGNLGAIIRTSDWFGLNKIIASNETADFYNQKVISATMGSFTRVKMYYTDLQQYLSTVTQPVFGTYMSGTDIQKVDFGKGGLILIGNESNGIHGELEKFVTYRVTIPRLGKAESLNAAIAAGILCYAVSDLE